MKSKEAWAWLIAGVLALGLNGIYHDGGAAWAHRAFSRVAYQVAERTAPVLALATGRAEWFVAKASTTVVQHQTASCPLAGAMARLQMKALRAPEGIARFEALSAQQEKMNARFEARMARMEANRARIEARVADAQARAERLRMMPVGLDEIRISCPRVHVNIPQVSIPVVDVSSPVVSVSVSE
jgi:hypothetical protein